MYADQASHKLKTWNEYCVCNNTRMLTFFVDFEENQLLDGDGCTWELPALLLITELGFSREEKIYRNQK